MSITQDCHSVKEALGAFWGASVEVSAFGDFCIVTLPLRTLDGRSIDVFVEAIGEMLFVHDGGKSLAELYAQGIHDSNRRTAAFESIARRYSAAFADDVFAITCKRERLERAILDIAQCATLAMHDVATHRFALEDESVKVRAGRVLEAWRPEGVILARDYEARGGKVKHRFDYAAISEEVVNEWGVAVNILLPTYNATIQSRKYGFLILDLEDTSYKSWPKLAVIGRCDEWQNTPRQLVKSLATRTIEIPSGHESQLDSILPEVMAELIRTAA